MKQIKLNEVFAIDGKEYLATVPQLATQSSNEHDQIIFPIIRITKQR